jgi:hypothetical protein
VTYVPGENYRREPYIDTGRSLPDIGQRVRNLTDGTHIEGVVSDVDPSGRRIRVQGFILAHQSAYPPVQSTWDYRAVDVWLPWKDFEVTTEDTSAAALARAGA